MSKENFIARSIAVLNADKKFDNFDKHKIAEMVYAFMQKEKREIRDFEFAEIVSQCEKLGD